MTRLALLVIATLTLSLASGCGAHASQSSNPLSGADGDPSWTPPGEVEVTYASFDDEAKAPPPPRPARARATTKPNSAQRPTQGGLRAARN